MTASDDRDSAVTVDLVSVVSNEPDDAAGSTTATQERRRDRGRRCVPAEGGEVQPSDRQGLNDHYRATDACGNATEGSATVIVSLERPVLTG